MECGRRRLRIEWSEGRDARFQTCIRARRGSDRDPGGVGAPEGGVPEAPTRPLVASPIHPKAANATIATTKAFDAMLGPLPAGNGIARNQSADQPSGRPDPPFFGWLGHRRTPPSLRGTAP